MTLKDNQGNAPLHDIAKSSMNCEKMMKDLMAEMPYEFSYGRIPTNFRGETPLHVAASNGRKDKAEFLMEYYTRTQSDPEPEDNYGNKPIHLSAKDPKSIEVLKYFMTKVDEKEPRNNKNDTPLHIAAANGNVEAVKFLVPIVNDIDPENSEQFTPWISAAYAGHLSVIQYLQDYKEDDEYDENYAGTYDDYDDDVRGINSQYTFNGGYDICHVSAANGHIHIVKYVCQYLDCLPITSEGIQPIHLAAEGGYKNIVNYLINSQSANPEVTTKDKYTPLHYAAKEGHLEVVKYLIEERNVNPEPRTNNGFTPLYFAACHFKVGMLVNDYCLPISLHMIFSFLFSCLPKGENRCDQ